jgi:hypothetical protein
LVLAAALVVYAALFYAGHANDFDDDIWAWLKFAAPIGLAAYAVHHASYIFDPEVGIEEKSKLRAWVAAIGFDAAILYSIWLALTI